LVLPLDAASLGLAGLGVASLGVAGLVVAGLGSINLVAPPSRRPKDYAPSPLRPFTVSAPSPSHPFTVAPQCRRPPNTADAAAPIKSRKYQQTTSIKQQKAAP